MLCYQTFSVRREVFHKETKSVYFTLAFAGIALMAAVVIGVAVLRRRSARSPQNQVKTVVYMHLYVQDLSLIHI